MNVMTKHEVELDRAHAAKYYGKYSAGYNRGLNRGRAENQCQYEERQRYRQFLQDLADLNQTCDGDLLPSEFAKRLETLLG